VADGSRRGQVAGVAGPPAGDGNELPAQGGDHGLTEDVSIAFDDPELAIPWPLAVTVAAGPSGAVAGGRDEITC
jgi:hypothetical protein